MKVLFLDYESLYDQKTYTLKSMTPVEYICDPRWETIGLAACEGEDGEVQWIEGPDVGAYLAGKNPEEYAVVHHNALFDACISSFRYNWVPKLTFCTLAMARAVLYHKTGSVSLANVALELGLGVKGTEIVLASGMNLAALKANRQQYASYVDYAKNDVRLSRAAFYKFMNDGFPLEELGIIDMVTRCAIQPRFEIDVDLVARHLHDVVTEKQVLLAKAMLAGVDDKDQLTSRNKLAALLESMGVDVPRKVSKTTGLLTYALAKTDKEFKALEEHEDVRVQTIVAARLGHQSTLEESRSQRFMSIGQIAWPLKEMMGKVPMPLRYSGAHTHRLSGEWKINVQNLRKGGKLRQALRAPAGFQVVAGDASQIEARIVGWITGCQKMVDAFARGDDVYSWFASMVYGYPVSKETPKERFLGKQAILGLGYGMGDERYEATIRILSSGDVVIDNTEAKRVVNFYRNEFPEVPAAWKFLDRMLYRMADKTFTGQDWGPVRFEYERIKLPSGLSINYYHLSRNTDGEWTYFYGKEQKWIFGGKVLENIVQALARIVVMNAAIRMKGALAKIDPDLRLNLQVHDELVYIVPDDLVNVVKQLLLSALRWRPDWAAALPLDAEVGSGQNYAEAK
jgi:DNA polymerase family A